LTNPKFCIQAKICLPNFFREIRRFPGMVVALLTRDSVRQALKSGITAEQIVDFLKMNAHPEMHKRKVKCKSDYLLPPTITDQVNHNQGKTQRFGLNCNLFFRFICGSKNENE
jgi:hypothetical protein